jgi:hypothetical protein
VTTLIVGININFEAYIAEDVILALNVTVLDITIPDYYNNTVTVKLFKTKAALGVVENIIRGIINDKVGQGIPIQGLIDKTPLKFLDLKEMILDFYLGYFSL